MTGNCAPTEIPISMGGTFSNDAAPVTDNACTIPTAADADCKRAETPNPRRMPRIGFLIDVIRSLNQGWSFSPDTEPLMVLIPIIRMTKPIMISPTDFDELSSY